MITMPLTKVAIFKASSNDNGNKLQLNKKKKKEKENTILATV
jgi:hypothetical protein